MSVFFGCIISAMFYITGICIFIEIGYLCKDLKDSKVDATVLILFAVLGILLTLSPFLYVHTFNII